MAQKDFKTFLNSLTDYEKTYELNSFWDSYGGKVESGDWSKQEFIEMFESHINEARQRSKELQATLERMSYKISEMFVKRNSKKVRNTKKRAW
ncbi:MAG: hypothetical protein US20_C0023G0019 [Candidatus Pacebacteria bacterium GW2011_GWF1_36_5]|nr:MAG: hypothetical protein US20_C0023G0019 [Candidatus Pacebacteria bacterium GW2011_GWF1_36_5]